VAQGPNPEQRSEGRSAHFMAVVIRRRGESFEGLFRRFKKRVQQDKIRSEVRRHRYFMKPSQIRKRKAARKLRKSRKTTRKMHRYLNLRRGGTRRR
jgi:small subunit ribosomal protein S21